ncbi:DUF998 domain-containing protein [Lysobacter niastensis]|uniref:DUF998 domain-containing protein n=1 Tax=Lysobacter niastensis TaxID=380629 RepID=A0ABS0B6Y0_9GAMM|nr:DUF998 domain-containing protein [Lysobacter niastensis]MBF6022875.1 DUF998 domain-containing protein [Lysobacter niastensis]
MIRLSPRLDINLGLLAAACSVLAVIGFGAALDGYSHVLHPLAWLGARGVPGALAFNLLAFVLPGALAVAVALRMRTRMPKAAGWMGGIGSALLLLSALAYTAQGLLPLDPADLDGPVSQWHATCWTLWWIAFVPGMALLAFGLRRSEGWRRLAGLAGFAAIAGLALTVVSGVLLTGPVAQRLLLALWWCVVIVASRSR